MVQSHWAGLDSDLIELGDGSDEGLKVKKLRAQELMVDLDRESVKRT